MPKFRECTIFRTRVIRQRVSLKIIVFNMEALCWSPSEELQRGGRKPVETSGVYFCPLNPFLLSVKLEYICIGTSLNILVAQNSKAYFRARNMLPRNNADCHGSWKNSVFRLRGRYPIKHSLFEREKEKKSLIHLLDQPPTAP